MEEIERMAPRTEIQIGKGQTDSFLLAAMFDAAVGANSGNATGSVTLNQLNVGSGAISGVYTGALAMPSGPVGNGSDVLAAIAGDRQSIDDRDQHWRRCRN
jgi:hypothetical protein